MAKQTVAVKLAPDLLARIDALAPRLSARWRDATRSDALRAVIVAGIEVVEAEAPPAPAPSALDPGADRR